ncbi:MAG: enoyl-ACP reductase [Anaerolineae bacterium]|nr:enoyl-ACP reductase [Anaerolineae bacterium]MDQ7035382.1 enoyl-ACP reductase [Anaerolineae bacterium]
MGLLDGKVALIFGIANNRSIAWGITKAFADAGATIALSYAMESLERRVRPLAEEIGCDFMEECDVTDDAALDDVFKKVEERFGKIDILVHSVAFANRDDLGGRFVDISRDGFKMALDISAYSLIAMAKRAEPLMSDGGSIISLTYYAGEKVMPDYNVMAVAKASLQIMTKYLAKDLGPSKIRVNTISAGPIKTLAAAGIPGFKDLLRHFDHVAPLGEMITIEDVGNAALFLASDLSKMITGEIMHVDSGYNVLGLTATREEIQARE